MPLSDDCLPHPPYLLSHVVVPQNVAMEGPRPRIVGEETENNPSSLWQHRGVAEHRIGSVEAADLGRIALVEDAEAVP